MHDNKKSETVLRDDISFADFWLQTKQWLSHLWLKKKAIAIVAIIGAIIGLSYTLIIHTKYVATTTFVLESTKKSDYSSLASKFGFGLGSSSGGLFQDDNNVMTFLSSRTIVAKSLYESVDTNQKNELLADRYLNMLNWNASWKDTKLAQLKFHVDKNQRTRLEDSVITLMYKIIVKKDLEVAKPDKDEDVIKISLVTTDELFSKRFNEVLVSNLQQFYYKTQTKTISDNVTILQTQVDSVRNVLNQAISGVAVSYDQNPNPNPAFQTVKVPSQRKLIDVQMNTAILEELVKNLEIEKIKLRKATPLIQTIDSPVYPLEIRKISKLIGLIAGGIVGLLMAIFIVSSKYYFQKLLKE